MSDEHDSWFKSAFGLDLGDSLKKVEAEAKALAAQAAGAVKQVVQDARDKVNEGLDGVTKGAAAIVKKVAGAVSPKGATAGGPGGAAGGAGGGGTGSFPLGGSVGRGGQNTPDDVRAVQKALGIPEDGKCGPQTIGAIETFQRSIGQARPDGRVDAGGATERALASGNKGGATNASPPAPSASPDDAGKPGADDGLLGNLAERAGGLVDGAKDLGGKVIQGASGAFDEAKQLAGKVVQGVQGAAGSALDEAKKLAGGLGTPGGGAVPGGAARNSLSLFDSYGGEVTFAEVSLGKRSLGQFFELEAKASGSVKFSGSGSLGNNPKKEEVEKGVLEFAQNVLKEGVANFKTETGAGIKPNATKGGRGVSLGGAVTLKTSVGPLTLEFATIEVSLVNFDAKKGITGPKASASTSRSLGYKHEIKGVELEGAIAVTLTGELTPDYVGIGRFLATTGADAASSAILVAIDAALIAGPPLLAGLIVAQGIVAAGELGARDRAILDGANDALQAAKSYANTMVGSEGVASGPRAKAAVALAKKQLADSAAMSGVSLDDLMTELRKLAPHPDHKRIYAQARQQIFSAYFAEIRKVISQWHKDHFVLMAFTTEADDFHSVEKKVAVVFARA